jgi:hypothetical protein
VGTWITTNAGGGGIRSLVLSADGAALKLWVEEWGDTSALPFAESVSGAETMSFYAQYELPRFGVRLQGYVVKGVLVIVSFVSSAIPEEAPGYMAKEFFYRLSGG